MVPESGARTSVLWTVQEQNKTFLLSYCQAPVLCAESMADSRPFYDAVLSIIITVEGRFADRRWKRQAV